MSSADLIQLEEQKMKSTTSTMVSSPANSAAALKAKAAAKVILNFKNSEGMGMSVDIGDEETRSSDLSLRAWLHHFDLDGNGKISHHLSPADTDSIPSREIRTLIYYVCTSKCFG